MDIIVSKMDKSFGDVKALKEFSAVFPAGELSCIMGRSGCGKSTLMNILAGLLEPDRGSVDGLPGKVSVIFQEDRLCEDFTPVTNVRIACGKNVTKAEIEVQLKKVGLGDSLYRPVRELSGGMKRRVAIVRALMADGGLVLMDEPFKGLDELTRAQVAEYVKERIRGKTAILVTHDESEVEMMGGRLIIMPVTENIMYE